MTGEDNKVFGIVEAAKKIGIELHRLYCWERCGVVNPEFRIFGTRRFRRYSQKDIDQALHVKSLVDEEGYTLKAAVRKIEKRSAHEERRQAPQ